MRSVFLIIQKVILYLPYIGISSIFFRFSDLGGLMDAGLQGDRGTRTFTDKLQCNIFPMGNP